jgi:hypothetical protein
MIDQYIDAERIGGAVRFPSGKVLHYRDYGQGFPEKDQRYIFFLRALSEPDDYFLLTAYGFKAGKVEPLDGHTTLTSQSQFGRYKELEENTFLNIVRQQINGGESK